ncbi:putative H4MPT-linked C1 transfer pathway protein [Geoglobus ahangari]|uniref:Putative H4MPT-linked C1 transfer pathway protein n=1 Tax=Geoglobus ahangari TaxID=113653 RepID=A0A0F7IGG5_9EURY|nr:hydantoinase/oxoprolinase family protein [Geoglobus ahangari]AKG91724.1 putative H4MPT-linked C1 transfer pathway protein [Geoglobus ahangari]
MRTSYSGVDVGGANVKVYRGDSGEVEIHYFPMWRRWRELEGFLSSLGIGGRVGVVLTAELADSFSSKAEGVEYVANAAKRAFGDVVFIDVDGNLRRDVDEPERFAANNWVASVKLLSESYESFIFADMGSTTTDIVPVVDGQIMAGRTDYERLRRNELLYFGMLRTPTFFLLKDNCSSELFSITADVTLVAGLIRESDYTCDTPDGRGRSERECMQRIARQFCADLEELGEDFVRQKTGEVVEEMVRRVSAAFEEKSSEYGVDLVVGCGIGEAVLEMAAERAGLDYVSVSKEFGEVSKAFPAYAIARLVERYDSG